MNLSIRSNLRANFCKTQNSCPSNPDPILSFSSQNSICCVMVKFKKRKNPFGSNPPAPPSSTLCTSSEAVSSSNSLESSKSSSIANTSSLDSSSFVSNLPTNDHHLIQSSSVSSSTPSSNPSNISSVDKSEGKEKISKWRRRKRSFDGKDEDATRGELCVESFQRKIHFNTQGQSGRVASRAR